VGKSRFLQALAEDETQRARLRVPSAAQVFTGGGFVRLAPPGPIDEVILHYDILRPHNKGFGSHAADPATSILHRADSIAFFTLQTKPDRLVVQLDERMAPYEQPPKKLRKLRPLYENDQFLADGYDRWFTFVERFQDVTTAHYIVDTDNGYRLTPFPLGRWTG